jgi:hypothetical protein
MQEEGWGVEGTSISYHRGGGSGGSGGALLFVGDSSAKYVRRKRPTNVANQPATKTTNQIKANKLSTAKK